MNTFHFIFIRQQARSFLLGVCGPAFSLFAYFPSDIHFWPHYPISSSLNEEKEKWQQKDRISLNSNNSLACVCSKIQKHMVFLAKCYIGVAIYYSLFSPQFPRRKEHKICFMVANGMHLATEESQAREKQRLESPQRSILYSRHLLHFASLFHLCMHSLSPGFTGWIIVNEWISHTYFSSHQNVWLLLLTHKHMCGETTGAAIFKSKCIYVVVAWDDGDDDGVGGGHACTVCGFYRCVDSCEKMLHPL